MDALEARRLLAQFSVDPGSPISSTNFHTITDAIAAAGVTAEMDDVINVAAGAFAEDVLINTPLSLRGAKFGIDPRPGRGAGETILTGQIAVTVDVNIDGFTVLNGSSAASPMQAAIYLNGATGALANNILTGGGPGSGLLANGVTGSVSVTQSLITGFATGARLAGDGTYTLANNTFSGNSAAGVEVDFAASGNASLSLVGNTLSNVHAPQLRLTGGDESDSVSLSVNTVTLEGTASYFENLSAIAPTGLGSSTLTLLRTTAEDTPIDIDLGVAGAALASTDATGLAGTLSTSGNVVTFTPSADFTGTTSFTFITTNAVPGTVNLTVTAVNDAPVATDGTLTTDEDTAANGTLSANDVDSSGLTYSIVSQPANGSIVITDSVTGAYTFTPSANFNGSTSFTFNVNDGAATSNTATVNITVNPVNDAPTASSSSVSTDEDTVLNGTLVGADIDSPSLTYSIVDQPSNGTVLITDASTGAYTFTPSANWNGVTSFTFQVSDGTATSNVGTVSVTVNAVNDAPVATDGSNSTDEDVPVSGTLAGNDIDSASLTYSVIDQPANGTVVITDSATGAYTFTPSANWSGSTSFTFQVSDGTATSNVGTVSLTVNALNDAPVAGNSNVSTDEDVALNGMLLGSDVDSAGLTFSIVDQPATGVVVITDAATGAFTFTPPANWNGSTSFTFQVSDGTATSNVGTVSVTVNAVNDSPVSTTIPAVTLDEGQSTTVALADYFSDIDEGDTPPDVLTYSLSGAPSFVTINPTTGVVTIAPGAADAGTYTISAIATDGSSATASTPLSVTVNDVVNNLPVISNLPASVTIDENALVPVFDVDATDPDLGQSLIYSIIGGNESGLFTIDPATGVITLTGPLDAEVATQYALVVRVTDNGPPSPQSAQGTLTVNVANLNDEPTSVVLSGPTEIDEGSPALFTAVATDADPDAVLGYKWFVDDVEQVGAAADSFTITFADEGSHQVRVEVSDRGAAAGVGSRVLTVNDVAPTVVLATTEPSVDEGTSFTLNIGDIMDPGAGDVAAIGQVAVWWHDGSYTLINETENAALLATLRAGGTVSVSHVFSDGQNVAREITVSIQDGLHSYVHTASIIVNNVAPTGNFAAITPSVLAGSAAFVNWFGQSDVSPEDRTAGLRYTYVLDVNVPGGDGVYNAGDVLVAGDATYANSTAVSALQIPGTLLATAGTYSVLGMLIDKDGTPFLTRQVFIDVTPSTFQVISLGGDHSGFTVVFNREINLSTLNLYDGTDATVDSADVILTRSTGQTIRGSLVINAARNGFDFVVTGGILSQGAYTVRLNSNSNAFKDLLGSILDGDYNGVAGGNYIATFGVNAPPGPVISVADFARGPGQPIDVIPGNASSDLPIMMNSPIAVSSINFQMRYDSTLMDVTSVVAGTGLPSGWTLDYSIVANALNVSLIKTSAGAANISPGLRELIRVVASVPNSASIYGKSHVLSFASIVVNGNESIEGTADRAVHKVVFVGDANRDGTLNVGDAGLIQSVVLGSVNGFDAYPIVDPVIIVDSSRNNTVDSQDASNAALSGFSGARPADVPAFTPVSVPVTIGVDPTYRLPTDLEGTPGQQVVIPLDIIDDARGIQSGQLRVQYDTTRLDISSLGILAGSLLGPDWQILTNVNDAEGWFEVGFYRGSPLAGASALTGTLLSFVFEIGALAADGLIPLTISAPQASPLSPTLLYDRHGNMLTTTAISGSVLISAAPPSVLQSVFNFTGASQSYTVVFSEDVSASISASDFELVNLTTNTVVNLVVSEISSDGRSVTLSFADTGGLTDTILKDGDYRLRVRAGHVSDAGGAANPTDIDAVFFFMNADLNHDRSVNFDDLLVLAQYYGTGSTFATGDINYDGQTGFDDLLVLAQRYGATLLAPSPANSRPVTKKTRWSDTVIN